MSDSETEHRKVLVPPEMTWSTAIKLCALAFLGIVVIDLTAGVSSIMVTLVVVAVVNFCVYTAYILGRSTGREGWR